MISQFSPTAKIAGTTAQASKDEIYALSGLNMVTPDQIIDTATKRYNKRFLGQSPFTINSRMLSRDSGDQRVAIRTRKGSSELLSLASSGATPITVHNANSVSGEQAFSSSLQFASPMSVPSYSLTYGFYALTFLTLHLRKDPGYLEAIQIRIWDDNGGMPGNLLATSSFDTSLVTSTSAAMTTWFMDAPVYPSSTTLWMTLDVVGDSAVKCYVEVSANAGGLTRTLATVNAPWFSSGTSVIFTAPGYKSGAVISAYRRYVQGETPLTIVHTGYDDLIAFQDNGTESLILSNAGGYQPFSNKFRYAQVDDRTILANGNIQPGYYDHTGFTALSAAPANAVDPLVWINFLFMRVGNKIMFSDLLTTTSNTNVWPVVNYFYPNTPLDPDQVVGYIVLKNDLFVFTKTTKYRVSMDDTGIASIDIQEVKGSKGAISQDLICTDGDFIYFIADDLQMYSFNGLSDSPTPISDVVQPEITAAQNPELTGFLHVHNKQIRYYFAKTPDTIVDSMLLYDLVYGEWFLDTGREVGLSITYPLEGSPLIEFSSKATIVFNGDDDGYSDAGKPIDFKYWTNYKAYGSGAAKKRIKRFRPIIKITGRRFTMQIGKDMDFKNSPDMRDYIVNGGSTTYGEGARYGDGSLYGSQPLVDNASGMSGRGKHIQYRFEKNGVNTPVELYGYIALFKEGTNK